MRKVYNNDKNADIDDVNNEENKPLKDVFVL